MQFDGELTNDFHGFDSAGFVAEPAGESQISSVLDAIEILEEVIQSSCDASDDQLAQFSQILWRLAQKVEDAGFDNTDPELVDAMSSSVIDGCNLIRGIFSGQPDAITQLDEAYQQVLIRFGDQVAQEHGDQENPWQDDSFCDSVAANDEPDLPSAAEIQSMLSQIREEPEVEAAEVFEAAEVEPPATLEVAGPEPAAKQHIAENSTNATAEPKSESSTLDLDEVDNELVDDELRCAFMDDAMRCLSSMESSLLSLESNPTDPAPLQTIGRELHTLKGASASIGLARLADYVHQVEDAIGEIEKSDQPAPLDTLLQYVDTIRDRINAFNNAKASNDAEEQPSTDQQGEAASSAEQNAAAVRPLNFDEGVVDDESVRVKASRLGRLMDMLSELVMSRNRRDSDLAHLISIHEDLLDNVARLRALNQEPDPLRPIDYAAGQPDSGSDNTALLAGISNDVLELAQRLRECYQSVADGNNHVSQFIRTFRQELVELRRTPINGLFNRLRRAVSDAARAEEKQVQLTLVGEETGIERSIQARLFEPLLHIVRNSVSHGIESSSDRAVAGKPPQGTITLQAQSGPDLLAIEVCDDGCGLDYEAIRRRGIERGLISPDVSSHKELAQLIFHPCFSTRDTASQISGRGVGMDVVAATLERMRGWVEVDSSVGQGTTIRLSIPLHSMIQHVMVFRSGGQLFAVPMQSVQSAGDEDEQPHAVCLAQLLELGPPTSGSGQERIVLGSQLTDKTQIQPSNTAILVDEIIGPEEVVVRPMPKLFRQHPVCVGATLSGLGEVVLLLDSNRLSQSAGLAEATPVAGPVAATVKHKILVVDDSAAARTRVVQSLGRYPVQIIQSSNGLDAWQTFQSASFDAVFSDIEMPRMTGLQLLAEIKKHPRGKEIPVVLVSSRTESSIRREAIQLGATACLEKPLTNAAMDSVWPKVAFTANSNP